MYHNKKHKILIASLFGIFGLSMIFNFYVGDKEQPAEEISVVEHIDGEEPSELQNNELLNEDLDTLSLGSKSRTLELPPAPKFVNAAKPKFKKEVEVILNDPKMSEHWGIKKTDSHKAWNISMGSKDIIVAVIDTGIDIAHKDLQNNLWVNRGEIGFDKNNKDRATNGIDDDGNGFVDDIHGWNFVANNNSLKDNHGHGTHIAGIVGAEGGNGFGISGIAPNVSIMALKYYDPQGPGSNNLVNTIKAIKYATKMGAHIINYSGGGLEYSAEEYQAIKEANDKGILFVAAAGNERSNSDKHRYYPADYPLANIISVTAANETDNILPSSNYGQQTVDIQAPGSNIYSALPNNSFGNMTGTSQGTAFVTGVAVLVMANNRQLTAEKVKKYILKTGDDVPPSMRHKTRYAKRLNSWKALATWDQDVDAGGNITINTATLKQGTFNPETDKTVKISSSGIVELAGESVDATDQVRSFGNDLQKILPGLINKANAAGTTHGE